MMEILTLDYIIGSIFCLVVAYFMLTIPPTERRKYNKYDEFERINYISIKHSIFKPRYLMFNLDHHNEGSWYYKWISPGSAKIPRITNAPTLFLKQTIASIKATEEKKIYTEWLINQLSEKAEKNSARKAYYKKLEKLVNEIYDNLDHSDVSTGEPIKKIIDDGYPESISREGWVHVKELGSNNNGLSKSEKVRNFADDFVKKLLDDEYKTNQDVIKALKKIDGRFNPTVKKELELLNRDGKPYEKRICINLSTIYEIKEGESIDWTWIRDTYKGIGLSISDA